MGLGVVAYRTGTVLAEREVSRLRVEVDRLTTGIAALRDEKVQLQQQAEAAKLAETQWRERYDAEVPTGKSRELFQGVQLAGAAPATSRLKSR